jgi:peptidoglycan/xylan/chitin deacetylase (PgdA/CDA1 family)
MRLDGTELLTELLIYAGDTALTNAWAWTPLDPAETHAIRVIKDEEWITYSLPWASAAKIGTPPATIQTLRVRARTANGNTATVRLNAISARPAAAWPDGVVSITFDDVYADQYTTAKPVMDSYGFSGVLYTIRDLVGPNISLAHLKEMQDHSGWQISCHGETNLTTMTLAEAERDIVYNQRFLFDNGFAGWDHYAWPNGAFDADLERLIAARFVSARSVMGTTGAAGGFESIRPTIPYRLRSRSLANGDSVAGITTRLDRAKADGSWLILTFHHIVTSPSSLVEYSTANFTAILDYINSIGIPVRTTSQVLRGDSA